MGRPRARRIPPARRILYIATGAAAGFALLNLAVAAAKLDRAPEEEFFRDVYSAVLEILPEAVIPFANSSEAKERVNNLGFRGPDTTWEKPDGVRRLVSLGDSTSFGVLVAREDNYTSLLGERLARLGAWETINCAVPGTNLLQHRIQYELKNSRLNGDIVMLYVVPNVREDLEILRRVYDKRAEPGRAALAEKSLAAHLPVFRLMRRLIKGSVSQEVRGQVQMIYERDRGTVDNKAFLESFREDLKALREDIVRGGAVPLWLWHANRDQVLRHRHRRSPERVVENAPVDEAAMGFTIPCAASPKRTATRSSIPIPRS
ncbi:MAG: hypothetical protein M5R36_18745 [Deltaproteobacteria bacterium]|nr:hypothetical protein [Deltaproteobacteria bacterium]